MSVVLEVKDLKKYFARGGAAIQAVDGISFCLNRGECLGIVGESGCGKSTAARLVLGLLGADQGSVLLNGREILGLRGKRQREVYTQVQMIFQNPQDSFDPRKTLGEGVMEGMRNRKMRKKEALEKAGELFKMVELEEEMAKRYPHQVSGGQCQRAAIARALACNPQILICDEATSALDVTVQAQIIKLLKKLQKETGISVLFICHDLALVANMCDRVLVMDQGRIIEEGTAERVLLHPKEEYTKELLASVF